jgi:hypothetical protein
MHIDRRSFLATLGTTAAINAMTSEALADALEHHMIETSNEGPTANELKVRRGTGLLFGGPLPSGKAPTELKKLEPMPDKVVHGRAHDHCARPLRFRSGNEGLDRSVHRPHRSSLQTTEGGARVRQQPRRAHVADTHFSGHSTLVSRSSMRLGVQSSRRARQ